MSLQMSPAAQDYLRDASIGERVLVERVSDAHPDGLRYLAGIGIRPGTPLVITGRGPVGGALFVEAPGSGAHAQSPSREIAEAVWVS